MHKDQNPWGHIFGPFAGGLDDGWANTPVIGFNQKQRQFRKSWHHLPLLHMQRGGRFESKAIKSRNMLKAQQ